MKITCSMWCSQNDLVLALPSLYIFPLTTIPAFHLEGGRLSFCILKEVTLTLYKCPPVWNIGTQALNNNFRIPHAIISVIFHFYPSQKHWSLWSILILDKRHCSLPFSWWYITHIFRKVNFWYLGFVMKEEP